jgi:hypothetical protein
MNPVVIFVVLIIIGLIAIAVCSVIINILNQIGDNIGGIDYKKFTGDCLATKESITEAVKYLDLTRSLAIIPLVLSILGVILAIVAIVFLVYTGAAATDVPVNASIFVRILTNKWLFFFVVFLLFLIFTAFTVVYALVLSNLNNANTTCFTGTKEDLKTPLGKLEKAKQITQYQLIICAIMAFVFLVFGILLIFLFKSGNKKTGQPKMNYQQFKKEGVNPFTKGLGDAFQKGFQNIQQGRTAELPLLRPMSVAPQNIGAPMPVQQFPIVPLQ